MAAHANGGDFEVMPENLDAVHVFIACGTQWRYRAAGNGSQVVGLDYLSVEAMLRLYRTSHRRDVFDKIRIMELAALEVFRAKHG